MNFKLSEYFNIIYKNKIEFKCGHFKRLTSSIFKKNYFNKFSKLHIKFFFKQNQPYTHKLIPIIMHKLLLTYLHDNKLNQKKERRKL